MKILGIPLNLFAPKHWGTWVGILLLRFFALLPYSWMKKLSAVLGYLFYPLAKRRKHIIETNIKLCFPDKTAKEQQQLSRKAFTSTVMALFEFSLGWWGSKNTLAKLHRVEGLENLNNALKKGKGVILLSSHFTTMEIAGAFLCQHIDNLVLTYKRSNNPVLEYFIRRNRLEKSAGLIKHKSLREILRSIRKGNVVWFAPDQDFGTKDSIFAPFMGVMTSTLLSTQRIAKITGAPVIAFYGARLDEESGYVIRLSPALENFPSENELDDATKINQAIEHQVRQSPEQYLWAHRRFKTRPEGEKDFYTKE
jgi:KDO2-lipid IV(A) lauroyltransferase